MFGRGARSNETTPCDGGHGGVPCGAYCRLTAIVATAEARPPTGGAGHRAAMKLQEKAAQAARRRR